MAKKVNTTEEDVRASVSMLYSQLLDKRKAEREEREARKQEEKELRRKEKEEKRQQDLENEDKILKMSKKERREAELESWRNVISGLTGDDLEYSKPKRKKKKYRKWIGEETGNSISTEKPKKHKKRNYNKEFENELHMLKALVADQNKFTQDLQKRYQIMAGPNTKDAIPLNKTQVDLASAINASRANSLGVLREIGNVKKTIADLYMKQRKLDSELGSGVSDISTTDLGLLGSSVAASLFGDTVSSQPTTYSSSQQPASSPQPSAPVVNANTFKAEEFDPASWNGGSTLGLDNSVRYESIPHSVVVEWHKDQDIARFKAVRDDTGEELVGCPVPTSDPSKLKFNEEEKTVRGEFDEIYKLEIH